MPRAANTGLHYKERIKSSELLANGLDLDRLQAFTAQLCNEMPRVNKAFRQLETIRDLELCESESGVQYLDHETLSDFIVSMTATYSTAFTKLRKFHKLDATKREEEKESKLANLRYQEDELRRHKLELEAKEAMLERLREAHRKEEEALASDRKMLHSREMGLKAERQKLLGWGSCADSVGGVSTLKRDPSGDCKLEEVDVKRELCDRHEEDKAHSIKRIKLEKEEPNEGVDVDWLWNETDKESEMDEEVDVKMFSNESDDGLNLECAARCEQCHELFDANNETRHFCFGHPGELVSRIWCRNLWPRNALDGDDGDCDGEKEDDEEEDVASRRWDCCGSLEGVEACNLTVRPIRLPKKMTTDVGLLRDLA